MDNAKQHQFWTLDKPAACHICGTPIAVGFLGPDPQDRRAICARCAGVWTPAQRRAMAETQRNPYRQAERKTGGKSRESMFVAAPKSELEKDEKKPKNSIE